MSKSRVCEEKTSSQANQTCNKKTNLLVYEREKGDVCKQPKTYVPPISSPQLKRIKVCTVKELRKICPQPPCPCPPKIPVPTFFQRFTRFLGFGAKSLVALSAVFVTYDMGIWGDAETTGSIYKGICAVILPRLVNPQPEKQLSHSCQEEKGLFDAPERDRYCCDKFPVQHESGVYEVQQKWNKIVTTTFSTIAGFPILVKNLSHQAYCKVFPSESCEPVPPNDEPCCGCE